MSFNQGQSPQEILESIKLEEAQRKRGRLKIFLGMAAGVGKTYAMLEEARHLITENIDVVVGDLEAHGRKDIEVLLKDLPQIPKRVFFYKDKEFKELNVETIMTLRPTLVLVDELAHSNVPGSKNEKRWQDVQELLDHGISVYTTLNIQHIESLNRRISTVTGVVVRETVPDWMIEKAYGIQLVDLTPEELISRLEKGQVYTGGQSKMAALNFFQKNKLAALRDILLQYVNEKIESDLSGQVWTKEGRHEWKPREKFLVAINESLEAQKIIKAVNRLAMQANASWLVVYVNTGKLLSEEDKNQLEQSRIFTAKLGAEMLIINDPDIALGIKRVAYQRNITEIILGGIPKNLSLPFFQGGSLLERLAKECRTIDIRLMRQEKYSTSDEKRWAKPSWKSTFFDYLVAAFLVTFLGGLCMVGITILGDRVIEFAFFLSVAVLSAFFRLGPAIFAALLFLGLWGYFYMPHPASFEDLLLVVLYALTAISFAIFVRLNGLQKELLRKNNDNNIRN